MNVDSICFLLCHSPETIFSFLPDCDKHSVWEVCSVADATGYFRVCHISPSFCVTLLISCGFILLISFFFFLFLIWPRHLACGILVRNLGSNPRTAPALEARSQPLDIQGSPYSVDFFSRSLCCYLYTLTRTHRHILIEPPSPPYSSSSFCQLAYLHPSIEYINPSFWLQFFSSTFISPLFL